MVSCSAPCLALEVSADSAKRPAQIVLSNQVTFCLLSPFFPCEMAPSQVDFLFAPRELEERRSGLNKRRCGGCSLAALVFVLLQFEVVIVPLGAVHSSTSEQQHIPYF
ncbi:unnamed protein product [Gongylonema pulchrum]|uniref:Secreted protein n=1 Tax=Gongylonema pulchrum TaxID=637853 RepID=A0A183E1N8_9BILA|nr:unnamed protein product [Gongylonema pulchrum]